MSIALAGSYGLAITSEHDEKYAVQDGYVEVTEDENFGIHLVNNSNAPAKVSVSVNDDIMGHWVLRAGEKATLFNPDPAYATGLFKAVRKGSTAWTEGEMDSVSWSRLCRISGRSDPAESPADRIDKQHKNRHKRCNTQRQKRRDK